MQASLPANTYKAGWEARTPTDKKEVLFFASNQRYNPQYQNCSENTAYIMPKSSVRENSVECKIADPTAHKTDNDVKNQTVAWTAENFTGQPADYTADNQCYYQFHNWCYLNVKKNLLHKNTKKFNVFAKFSKKILVIAHGDFI